MALASQFGCTGCHPVTGGGGVGPTWKGLFGKTETLEGGSTVFVETGYLRESIVSPGAKIVQGFPNIMPTNFAQRLSSEEIDAIIEYIKTLQ
jgi:cytochrome c1